MTQWLRHTKNQLLNMILFFKLKKLNSYKSVYFFPQVYIAQREFEHAVSLIFKARSFCKSHSDSPLVREAKAKLDNRTKHLLNVLRTELSTDKSVQGGPRSARRAVQLLAKLGRTSEACQLFLRHRAAIMHSAMKWV